MSASKGKIIIVSGPSGVGKGTILKEVFRNSPLPLELSVSATTRKPRPGEENGVNYHFLTEEEFELRRQNGEFVECFEVFQGGDWYGTLKSELDLRLKQGKWVVLEIDVQGGLAVKEIYPDAVTIFLLTPNLDILKERLRERGTESEEAITRRFTRAVQELSYRKHYTYQIVNDHLKTAVDEFCALLKSIQETT
ncbi:MAG: guanylate kinase [Planctomycetaceae bacterium]|jgi:guanylate kinase|nr:guanylate kinase [Planctomycetaceae bacterium]